MSAYFNRVTDIFKSRNGTLYINGTFSTLMISTNGGDVWNSSGFAMYNEDRSYYEAGNTVFAFGLVEAYKTTNNGATWEHFNWGSRYPAENAVVVNDQDVVFYEEDTQSDARYLSIYNENVLPRTKHKEISIDPEFFWTENDQLLALSDSKIYSTTDMGDNWTEELDIIDKLKSIDQFRNDEFSFLGFHAKKNIIVINFYASNSDSGKDEQHFVISYDSGKNWEIANISELMIFDQNHIKIFDNEVYVHGIGVFVYDRVSKRFENANYNAPLSLHYRDFQGDFSFAKISSNDDNNSWIKGGNSDSWRKVNEKTNLRYSFNKDKYYLENNVLSCEREGKTLMTWENIKKYDFVKDTKDYIILQTIGTDGFLNFEILVYDGRNYSFDDIFALDFDGENEICYVVKGDDDYPKILRGEIGKLDQADTLYSDFLQKQFVPNISFDGDNITISQYFTIHSSTDNGQNWALLYENKYFDDYSNPTCYNQHFYVGGVFGFLKSSDGIVWENLIENYCDAYVNYYEFNPNGQIYLYTSEGVFASEKPISVDEGKHLKTPSISIFPNPAQDVICVDVDCTVDYIEIFDLSGNKLIQTESSNEVDITALQQGSYFLKIYSGEKAYFRQFIVE